MTGRVASFVLCLCLAGPALAAPGLPAAATEDADWWHTRYLVDYGIIALGGTIYLFRNAIGPADNALIGPTWDPDNPTAVLDAELSPVIGGTHIDGQQGETVTTGQVIGLVGLGGLILALQEGVPWAAGSPGAALRCHETLVGYLESVSITVGLTEAAKLAAGRLRPDFQDRTRRHLCSKDGADASICTSGKTVPLDPDPKKADDVFVDGRKSFFSGHSSNSFNFATFTSLAIGGGHVWSEDATTLSRTLGVAAQVTLMGTATYIAQSRLGDGRHHLSDVLTGSLLGIAVANFSYWRRFGLNGKVRPRAKPGANTVTVEPGPGDIGLSVTLRTL